MANIRTRETASGPRYDVKFKFNGRHRMRTFQTFEDARAYKRKVEEGDELAGLYRTLVTRRRAALPARDGGAEQGDCQLSGRRHHGGSECVLVRSGSPKFLRGRGISAV